MGNDACIFFSTSLRSRQAAAIQYYSERSESYQNVYTVGWIVNPGESVKAPFFLQSEVRCTVS